MQSSLRTVLEKLTGTRSAECQVFAECRRTELAGMNRLKAMHIRPAAPTAPRPCLERLIIPHFGCHQILGIVTSIGRPTALLAISGQEVA
jgi:hypothetical protein